MLQKQFKMRNEETAYEIMKRGHLKNAEEKKYTIKTAPLQKRFNLKNLKFWGELNCIDQIVHR